MLRSRKTTMPHRLAINWSRAWLSIRLHTHPPTVARADGICGSWCLNERISSDGKVLKPLASTGGVFQVIFDIVKRGVPWVDDPRPIPFFTICRFKTIYYHWQSVQSRGSKTPTTDAFTKIAPWERESQPRGKMWLTDGLVRWHNWADNTPSPTTWDTFRHLPYRCPARAAMLPRPRRRAWPKFKLNVSSEYFPFLNYQMCFCFSITIGVSTYFCKIHQVTVSSHSNSETQQ